MADITTVTEETDLPMIGLVHRGKHSAIGPTFHRLAEELTRRDLWATTGAWAGMYHGDPTTTPEDDLTSYAACAYPADAPVPDGFERVALPAGRYAETIHDGPYDGLPDAWAAFTAALRADDAVRLAARPSAELYLNDPSDTAPEDLRTRLLVAVD